MMRIKDPAKTVKFYEFLGMKVINKMDFPDSKFSLYFLAYDGPESVSSDAHWSNRQGLIELTHNHGSENDPSFKIATGNAEPGKGFGHVCISVDNIQAACTRLEEAGYKFQKKLTDGRMRHIAFVLDPDGYWVEIVCQQDVAKTEGITETNVNTYRSNHSMIRVKDAQKSLKFYQDVMGMTLINTKENPDNKFNLYFLAYADSMKPPTQAHREGILELTWNYGTEDDPNFKYHNGNDDPQGFGHICISVDDLEAACERFEKHNVNWKKRINDGRMKGLAFIFDPDGYWIEVIQNQKLKPSSDL